MSWPDDYRIIVNSADLPFDDLVAIARTSEAWRSDPEAHAREWQAHPCDIVTRARPEADHTGMVLRHPGGKPEWRLNGELIERDDIRHPLNGRSDYAFDRIRLTDKGMAMVGYRDGTFPLNVAAALAELEPEAFLAEYTRLGWDPMARQVLVTGTAPAGLSFNDLMQCDPERDRHVWTFSGELDEVTGEMAVSPRPGPETPCRCGARRYGERER